MVATLLFNPFLTLLSIVVGILAARIAGTFAGVITTQDFIYGIQYAFIPYYITCSLIKTLFFAFIIAMSLLSRDIMLREESLEVGRASTKAV